MSEIVHDKKVETVQIVRTASMPAKNKGNAKIPSAYNTFYRAFPNITALDEIKNWDFRKMEEYVIRYYGFGCRTSQWLGSSVEKART